MTDLLVLFHGDRSALCKQTGQWSASIPDRVYYTEEDQLPEIENSLSGGGRESQARLAVELLPLENFFPQKSITKYLDRIPAATAIPRSFWSSAKQRRRNLQMNFGCGSAIWRVTASPPQYAFTGEYDSDCWKRAFMSTLSAANLFTSMDKYQYNSGVAAGVHQADRGRCCHWAVDTSWYGRTEVCSSGTRIPIWVTCSTMVPASPAGCVMTTPTRQLLEFIPYDEDWKNKGMGISEALWVRIIKNQYKGGILLMEEKRIYEKWTW